MTKISGADTSEDDGEAGHGVEVQLIADQKVWKEGEIPSFTASVRNEGSKDWIVYQTQAAWVLQLDGERYVCGTINGKSSWLPPGREYKGIPIALVNSWQRVEGGTPLDLRQGKHTLRVMCPLFPAKDKEATPSRVEVISNPVEFEVIPAR